MASMQEKTRQSRPRLTGATIVQWRELMGYSQRLAAKELGCSREALDGWEKDRHEVPIYIGLAMNALALNMRPYGEKADDIGDE